MFKRSKEKILELEKELDSTKRKVEAIFYTLPGVNFVPTTEDKLAKISEELSKLQKRVAEQERWMKGNLYIK